MSDAAPAAELRFAAQRTFPRRVSLASYPRSGNSLVRRLLERATGIYTGSDTRPDRTMSLQLREFGMLGEGVVDSTVWMVKTHYPERRGHRPYRSDRAVLVVRNAFDAIDSYFNMVLTESHTLSVEESEYERFRGAWRAFVKREVDVWKRFHNHWVAAALPVLFLRYEDLVQPALRTDLVRAAIEFINPGSPCAVSEPGATAAAVCAAEDAGRVYNPRSGQVGGSLRHFDAPLIRFVMRETEQHARHMGYWALLHEHAAVAAALALAAPRPLGGDAAARSDDEAAPQLPPLAATGQGAGGAEPSAVDGEPEYDLGAVPDPRPPLYTDEVPAPDIVRAMASPEAFATFAPPAARLDSGALLCAGQLLCASLAARADAAALVSSALLTSAPMEVNLGMQVRLCTAIDPWGRGMRWKDGLPVTPEDPIRIRSKA